MTATVEERFNPEAGEAVVVARPSLIDTMEQAGLVTATSLSLDLPGGREITYDQYEALGRYFGSMNRSCSWWIGDWLLFGEGTFGERWAQAATHTGLAEQTLSNRMTVCRHVPPSRRRASLPFAVHAEVASLPAREQKVWLDRAERHGWTRAELRKEMKATRVDTKPLPPAGEPLPPEQVLEAARQVIGAAQEYGGDWLVPREAMARLAAAVGAEDE